MQGMRKGAETMLRCPICRGLMKDREAEGHYGARHIIFQCPECSGIWVDGEVGARVTRDSALKIEAAIDFEEISTEPREIAAACPRCQIHLMEQAGGGLPEGLHIDYCQKCHGFWFDKGELMIYKSYQEKKRQNLKKREASKGRPKSPLSASATGGLLLETLSRDVYVWGHL